MTGPATALTLYRKLISLYPSAFRDRFGESMEQTFRDLWREERQTKRDLFGFVLWTFIETAAGICREHLSLISQGDVMQAMLKTFGSSALIGVLLILPLMIMQLVNRRTLNEEFPFVLFFVLWLNVCAISLILLPIVLARRARKADPAGPVPAQGNTFLANPWAAVITSILLFLLPGILPLLDSLGWISVDTLFNGPDPAVRYVPGQILAFSLILFPVAAGVIAGGPIARTLRAGGSLFAHPINLLIVGALVFLFAWGLGGLVVDQWPCFLGVPNCD